MRLLNSQIVISERTELSGWLRRTSTSQVATAGDRVLHPSAARWP